MGTSSLEELFNRDPLKLTDDDVAKMVTELRARRHLWAQQEKEKADKPKRGAKAPKPQIDIADLEIEL